MTKINLLSVKLNGEKLGNLAIGKDGLCRFEYEAGWLKNGFSISPYYLPLKSGLFTAKAEPFDGLFGVFADSMPDGWGNLLLDRFLQSKGISLSSLTVLDRLAYVGSNGMGALSYEPDNSLEFSTHQHELEEISKQVAAILSEKADIPTITSILEQTGSSGGARPKVLIHRDDASWMVKFPSSNDPINIGEQEYFYSQLAKKCGIEMPETRLFEGRFFGTKLFDRDGTNRFHVHSAAGLLHASHRYPSLDYAQLAKCTYALTRSWSEVGRLLAQMVFNVLIENKDDHSKNFSFIYKADKWQLSPAYDLVLSSGLGGEHSTSISGVGNPKRKDMLKLAHEIGFPKEEMNAIFERVYDICLASEIGDKVRQLNII